MAIGSAGGTAAGATTAGSRAVNQERRGRAREVPAPVQRQADLMSFLPDVTRANAPLFTIWPALEHLQGDETSDQSGAPA